MNQLEKIARALRHNPELKAGARAALDVLDAALTGKTAPLNAKYASWLELDQAHSDVKLEQLKSDQLRNLFQLALSFAVRAIAQRR